MTSSPVRTGRLFVRWTSRLVTALRRSLVTTSAYLELASTTDVSRHEHPRKHPFRRLPVKRCGKPANVRLRDRPWVGWLAPGTSLNGAGPPCGHPTSNGCALDGANAGFRPFDTPCSRHEPSDESAQSTMTKVAFPHRASSPKGALHAEVGEASRLSRPQVPLSSRTL